MVAVRDPENITVQPELDDLPVAEFFAMHWKRKMYWSTLQPMLHSVLAFILDVEPRTLPAAMTSKATITSDGHIMCSCIDPQGEARSGAYVTSVSEANKQFTYWANQMRLTDDEKRELTDLLNDWIGQSYSGERFRVS